MYNIINVYVRRQVRLVDIDVAGERKNKQAGY